MAFLYEPHFQYLIIIPNIRVLEHSAHKISLFVFFTTFSSLMVRIPLHLSYTISTALTPNFDFQIIASAVSFRRRISHPQKYFQNRFMHSREEQLLTQYNIYVLLFFKMIKLFKMLTLVEGLDQYSLFSDIK